MKSKLFVLFAFCLSSQVLAATHECLAERQLRIDNSNTGTVDFVETSSSTVKLPAEKGQQAHATLTLQDEKGKQEPYMLYVWNTGASLVAELTFEGNGQKKQLGLQMPIEGSLARSFDYWDVPGEYAPGESHTVVVTLVCRSMR